MRDSRIICLTCISKDLAKHIDLCISCIDRTVSANQFDHSPDHLLVKVRYLLQHREKRNLSENAWSAVDRAKVLFPPTTARPQPDLLASVADNEVDDDSRTATGDDIEDPAKLCVCCNTLVSVPFWICITCEAYPYQPDLIAH